MNLLGSPRIVTQDFQNHRYAEDYAGVHLSDVRILGKAKVVQEVNKYRVFEDSIDYNDYINNRSSWKDGVYFNCVSISGKKVRYHQSELGGNQVKLECYMENKRYYFKILHLANVFVEVGDIISSDTLIGTQGNTGLVSSTKARTNITYGSHVHFEVIDNNYNRINPREYAMFNVAVDYGEQTNEIDNSKKQIEIVVDKIDIKKSNSVNSEVIGAVYSGEVYSVVEEVLNDKYTWYKIETNLGLNGYIGNEKGKNLVQVYDVDENVEGDYHQVCEDKVKNIIFECQKDGLYALKMKSGEKLYIE